MPWRKGNRLKLVSEADATASVREEFEQVKAALGVPYVGSVFQAYAAYPEFLALAVGVLKNMAAWGEVLALSERLRADAYTRVHNYFQVPNLGSDTARKRDELAPVIELLQYTTPLEMLLLAALLQSFEGAIGREDSGSEQGGQQRKPEASLYLVPEEEAPIAVKKRFADIKRVLAVPYVPDTFRALANWPDFFDAYWETARALAQSPLFQEYAYRLHETVWDITEELPGPIELTPAQMLEAGVLEEDIPSVVRITEMFCSSFPAITLLTAVARIGLDGGNLVEQPTPAGRHDSAA